MTIPGEGSSAASRLLSIIEKIESHQRLAAEEQEQIKQAKKYAKDIGFDVGAINEVLRARKLTPQRRGELGALVNIYMTALGMSDSSLSDAARRRLAGQQEPNPGEPPLPFNPPPAPDTTGTNGSDSIGGAGGTSAEPPPEWHNDDDGLAMMRGGDDAKAGKPVIANPFPPGDPRRVMWDIGWCQETGSTGMDIPSAWKPAEKPKKANGEDAPEGGDGGEGDSEE